MIPRDLIYDFPWGSYWLLFLVPFIWLFWKLADGRIEFLSKFQDKDNLLVERSSRLYWIRASLLCLAWVFSVIAFMQPKGNGRYADDIAQQISTSKEQAKVPKRVSQELIFFLDVSASMGVKDTRLGKSRLDYAKDIIEATINQLNGESVALYAFTSQVSQLVPLTHDYLYLRMILRNVQINEGDVGGTDFSVTTQYIKNKILEKSSSKSKTIIMLSDGGDTNYEGYQQYINAITKNISGAAEGLLRIDTIGMGSEKGGVIPEITDEGQPVLSSLEPKILQALSLATGGRYFQANEFTPFSLSSELLKQIKALSTEEVEGTIIKKQQNVLIYYDLFFQIPLGLAILCLLTGLYLPQVKPRQLMNKISFLFIFINYSLCASAFAFAETCPELPKKDPSTANALYTLNDFAKAQSLYEKMLTDNTCSWQRHMITTNISSALLERRQWDTALFTLQSIPLNDTSFPLLIRQVKLNSALAYIGKAEDLIANTPNSTAEAFQFLKQSLFLLEEVKKIDCAISSLEKAPECIPKTDFASTRLKAKQLLTKNFEKQQSLQNHLLSPLEKIRLLLKSINDSIFDLTMLQSTSSVDNELLNEYIEAQIEQSQDTLQLIETVRKDSNINETLETLHQADTNSKDSIQAIKIKDFAAAKSHLENSRKRLKELLSLLSSSDPVEGELQELLISYSELLNKEWLIENDILALQDNLSSPLKTLSPESHPLVRKRLEEANDLLSLSLKSLQGNANKAAKFFLIKSFYDVQLALEAFNMPKELTPVYLLEIGVLTQQQAVNLTSLAKLINDEKDTLSVIPPLLTKAQHEALESLSPFVKAVLAKQHEDFHVKREPCQERPWNEVIPLYQKGTDAALMASNLLTSLPLDWKTIDERQKEALNDWSEALERLKKHQKDEDEKGAQNKDKQSSSKPIDQTLELLEQMEQEDKTKPPHPKVDSGVKKPW